MSMGGARDGGVYYVKRCDVSRGRGSAWGEGGMEGGYNLKSDAMLPCVLQLVDCLFRVKCKGGGGGGGGGGERRVCRTCSAKFGCLAVLEELCLWRRQKPTFEIPRYHHNNINPALVLVQQCPANLFWLGISDTVF